MIYVNLKTQVLRGVYFLTGRITITNLQIFDIYTVNTDKQSIRYSLYMYKLKYVTVSYYQEI